MNTAVWTPRGRTSTGLVVVCAVAVALVLALGSAAHAKILCGEGWGCSTTSPGDVSASGESIGPRAYDSDGDGRNDTDPDCIARTEPGVCLSVEEIISLADVDDLNLSAEARSLVDGQEWIDALVALSEADARRDQYRGVTGPAWLLTDAEWMFDDLCVGCAPPHVNPYEWLGLVQEHVQTQAFLDEYPLARGLDHPLATDHAELFIPLLYEAALGGEVAALERPSWQNTVVNPAMLAAIWLQESGFDHDIRNPTSTATGLGQFLVGEGDRWGLYDRTDPVGNAFLSAFYLGEPCGNGNSVRESARVYHDGAGNPATGHGPTYGAMVEDHYAWFSSQPGHVVPDGAHC